MENLILASSNQGKLKELQAILNHQFHVCSMGEIGFTSEIAETGSTFQENSYLKAKAIHDFCHQTVLSDDSGLEIDFLNGAPGVYSARFLGETTPYAEKNSHILSLLAGVPMKQRTARFRCVITVIFANGKNISASGKIEGFIAENSKGENGFGYDPIFYVPEYHTTMAEIPPQLKNQISHRGQALKEITEKIKQYYQEQEESN